MAITNTVGKVTIGYTGPELTMTPNGTGIATVDNSPGPVTALYNPYRPDVALLGQPVTTGLLDAPSVPAVTPTNAGVVTTTWYYQAIATYGGHDSMGSGASAVVSNAATLDGTHFNIITWNYVPGADGFKLVRSTNGTTWNLVQIITDPGTTGFTDTGAGNIGLYTFATYPALAGAALGTTAPVAFWHRRGVTAAEFVGLKSADTTFPMSLTDNSLLSVNWYGVATGGNASSGPITPTASQAFVDFDILYQIDAASGNTGAVTVVPMFWNGRNNSTSRTASNATQGLRLANGAQTLDLMWIPGDPKTLSVGSSTAQAQVYNSTTYNFYYVAYTLRVETRGRPVYLACTQMSGPVTSTTSGLYVDATLLT